MKISSWGDVHCEASASKKGCKKSSGLKKRQNIFIERADLVNASVSKGNNSFALALPPGTTNSMA